MQPCPILPASTRQRRMPLSFAFWPGISFWPDIMVCCGPAAPDPPPQLPTCVVYAHSAKRSASVPHSSMPSGKSAACPALARATSFASKFPPSRVACSPAWDREEGSPGDVRDCQQIRPGAGWRCCRSRISHQSSVKIVNTAHCGWTCSASSEHAYQLHFAPVL
jgi:hypothetical protein